MTKSQQTESFNKLTPAEAERLALLMEEMGEAIQAAGKILRHGYESSHPDYNKAMNNRHDLARELGHVLFALDLITRERDLDAYAITTSRTEKASTIAQYLHHQ